MTSVVDHNDWLIGYMDHNDYDSINESAAHLHGSLSSRISNV